MAATPDEALKDLLEDAQRRLAAIRLEVPALGDGKPSAPTPAQWAAAELAEPAEAALPPRPSGRPPERAGGSLAPEPPATEQAVEPVAAEPPPEEAVERVASAPVEAEPPAAAPAARPAPPPTPPTAPPATPFWRARPVAAAAALGAAAALAAALLLRGEAPPAGPVAQSEDGRWFSAGEREVVVHARGERAKGLPLRSTWRALALTPGWIWGIDGVLTTVERVAEDGSGARAFQLDHAPAALFARHPHLWTIDPSRRQARQYLITESMLGTFLQPLDARRLPLVAPEADLFVEEDGRLLVLERGAGVLSVVDAASQACAVPVPGGARLVSAGGRAALVVESGGTRALRSLPALCVPTP